MFNANGMTPGHAGKDPRFRRRNERLDTVADEIEQGLPAVRVQLAHDIVQEQDRIFPRLGLDVFQLRQFQGQDGRPLLPLGAVFPQIRRADGKDQVVPVRPDRCRLTAHIFFEMALQEGIVPFRIGLMVPVAAAIGLNIC